MENLNDPLDQGVDQPSQQGLQITPTIRQNWQETGKWALFFAVLGFIYLGFIALTMLFATVQTGNAFSAIFGILIVGGFVFVPTWLIFQFSQNIKTGLQNQSSTMIGLGFRHLRRLYQFGGILMIIVLAFYAIFFLFALAFWAGR